MVYMFGLVGAHPSGNDQLLILIILELVYKQLQVLLLVLDLSTL